jgi:predicted ATPase
VAALNRRILHPDFASNPGLTPAEALLHNPALLSSVAGWLQRMEIVDNLTLDPDTGTTLVAHKYGRHTPVLSTGTGLSKVLPLLTTLCTITPGSTLLLEEPEAHLHPLAQAVLAELLTEAAQRRQLQIIMETHSEHLFRRLQTLIARGSWQSCMTAAYYIEPSPVGPLLKALQLDSHGRVLNWPDRFFGDTLGDTREQARLILSSMQARNL